MRRMGVTRAALLAAVSVAGALVAYGCVTLGSHGADPAGAAAPNVVSGQLVDGVRVVEVKARKFEFDPARIVVRQGEKVRLEVTSQDVTHGFAMKSHDVNEVLPPQKTVAIEFDAGKPGTYRFRCSVYCGDGHNSMRGAFVVLRQADQDG